MNRSDFITCLAGRLPYDKQEIEFMLEIMKNVLDEGLKNDRMVKTPFGTFELKVRKERKLRAIHSGELITLPACDILKFKPIKDKNG